MKHTPTDSDRLVERALREMVRRDSPELPARVLARLSYSQIGFPLAKLAVVCLVLAMAMGAWLVLRSRPVDTMPETSTLRQPADVTKTTSVPPETEIAPSTPARELSVDGPTAMAPPRANPVPDKRARGDWARESGERARHRELSHDSRTNTTGESPVLITSLPSDTTELLPASELGDDPTVLITVEPLSIPRLAATQTQIEAVDIAPLVIAPIELAPLDAESPR